MEDTPSQVSRATRTHDAVFLTRFTGAQVPHGMVAVGMDTDAPGNVRHYIRERVLSADFKSCFAARWV